MPVNKKTISIIIPVYNCEQTLPRCLDSVISQTYKNLEIIIVDDGSNDGTEQIYREYAKKHDNIVIIKQENQGAAAARRAGVRRASGYFLGFVDADDYIDVDMYEVLIKYMKDAELVLAGYIYDGREVYDALGEGLYKGEERIKYFYSRMLIYKNTNKGGITTSSWNKLYITEKAKKIFEEIDTEIFMGEDAEFLFKYALSVDSICITRECKYHYMNNPGSIMHSQNKNYLKNVSCLYLSLSAFFEQSKYKDVLMPQLGDWIFDLLDRVTYFMGIKTTVPKEVKYTNCYFKELEEKSIILYGAGRIGQNYYRVLQKKPKIEIVYWVDKNCKKYQDEGLHIESVEKILESQYDYIVIAVKDEKLYETIKNELIEMGISNSKIWWKPPFYVGDLI